MIIEIKIIIMLLFLKNIFIILFIYFYNDCVINGYWCYLSVMLCGIYWQVIKQMIGFGCFNLMAYKPF